MVILKTPGWEDYELIDSGDGEKLERFGKYLLVRPDPQILWKKSLDINIWNKADAIFKKTIGENGKWEFKKTLPDKWLLGYKNLKFYIKLTPFKHTGVFPEQSLQWDFIAQKIEDAKRPVNILNLFAYTGISSLIAASTGAKVTHLDASYPTIGWARENQVVSNLKSKPLRYILDDALKFCQREIRRGVKYDGIIMDPPVLGHGPKGEKWDFNKSFPVLIGICRKLLSENPLFIIVNAYAISASSLMLENVLSDFFKNLGGSLEVGELALEEKENKRLLSTGIFARWSK